MRPELHPDAAKNFDEKARVLFAAVAPESQQEPSEPPTDMFRPGGHVVASYGEGDYSEFKITGRSDRLGRTIADILLFHFEESVQWFLGEASKAHTLLRMYEAVLGRDAAAATAAMDFTALPSYAVDYWVDYVDVSEAQDPLQRALETALWWAQKEAKCQRTLLTGDDPSDPTEVKVGWSFRTLLGAMYQQMFWLMSSGGNVTRCKFCGELVELSAPQEGEGKRRKPPQHKVFCDRRCQQSHYYHTKVKPRRSRNQKT